MKQQPFTMPKMPFAALRALAPLVGLCVAIWAIVGGVYANLLSPASARLVAAEHAFESAKATQTRLLAARKSQEQLQQAKKQVDDAWQALPMQDQFSSLALAIAELGRLDHVAIPGMSYAMEQPNESALPAKATITFQATGGYASIYRFLHRLESADSYLVIESMDVTRVVGDVKTGSTLIGLNIRVATFLRRAAPSARTLS